MNEYLSKEGLRQLCIKIHKALQRVPNENLLDNWYFVGGGSQQGGGQFPINQRGQTEYNTAGYAIDGWKIVRNGSPVSLVDEGINLAREGIDAWIQQTFKNSIEEEITGKTVTFSVLTTAGLYFHTTHIPESGTTSWDEFTQGDGGLIFENDWHMDIYHKTIRFWSVTEAAKTTIVAAKLELGDHQTLAHKEGGRWVLNRVPDYRTELAKCKYYQRVFYRNNTLEKITLVGYTYGSQLIFPFLSSMAKVPAIVAEDDAVEVRVVGHDGPISVTAMNAMAGPSDYGLIITINTSTTFQGDNVALLFVKNMKKLIFDAN